MKINPAGNNFILSNLQKKNRQPHVLETAIKKAGIMDNFSINETSAVKVTISAEGKKSNRDNLQTLQPEGESYDGMVARRNELLKKENRPKILADSTCYMFKLIGLGPYATDQTVEEKAANVLQAYAETYHEIVQGYESGQRNFFVQDSTSKTGYRKITMSEEIDALNKAYIEQVDYIEQDAKNAPKYAAMLESMANQMETDAKLKMQADGHTEKVISLRNKAMKLRNQVIPEDAGNKMIDAAKAFVSQYVNQKSNGNGIKSMLENIKIF